MHFQLFIPGASGKDPRLLIDVGLADFVQGAEFEQSDNGPQPEAPEGGFPPVLTPGVIVAWRRPGQKRIGYEPDAQTWIPAVKWRDLAAARYWIGFWDDALPTSGDLLRLYPQPGATVMLEGGGGWRVPEAKKLEADLIARDDGGWGFEVQRKYHRWYLEYRSWLSWFGNADPETAQIDVGNAATFVLDGLRINYRLLPEVVSHLRLFTTENVPRALFAVMGHNIDIGG